MDLRSELIMTKYLDSSVFVLFCFTKKVFF